MARTAAQVAYDLYYSQARLRFMRGQVATSGQIRAIFRRAAEDTAQRMIRLLPSQPSAGSLAALLAELDALAYRLSDDVLVATLNGIELSSGAAVTMARRSAEILLAEYYSLTGITALYGSVNTRAVVALATRTHSDGLRLSDRVWRVGRQWRGEVARSTESAVARGLDSRTLAKEVQTHLRPGTVSPHTPAVRRRLGLSRSVDWRAMRLARTEMNHAAREATILGHGAHPAYRGVNWVLSSSHPFEDECDDLANDSPYAPGHEPDDPHVQCMCHLQTIMEDSDSFDARMQRWLNDPGSEPGIEAWHQDFAQPFFDGRPITAPGGGIVAPSARRVSQEKTVEQVYQELRAELRAHAGRG